MIDLEIDNFDCDFPGIPEGSTSLSPMEDKIPPHMYRMITDPNSYRHLDRLEHILLCHGKRTAQLELGENNLMAELKSNVPNSHDTFNDYILPFFTPT